jgi:hypothetical protein
MEPTRRVTLKEAAELLGVSKEAVRKRVMRGTIPSDKGEDGRVYVYVDAVDDEPPTHEPDALISQLRDEIAYLREESRRKDEIIMQQAMTMRQLTAPEPEPPPEPPEPPTTATEQPGRVEEPQAPLESPQTPTERPWWRRLWEWEPRSY